MISNMDATIPKETAVIAVTDKAGTLGKTFQTVVSANRKHGIEGSICKLSHLMLEG